MNTIWNLCELIIYMFELCVMATLIIGVAGFIVGASKLSGLGKIIFKEIFCMFDIDKDD